MSQAPQYARFNTVSGGTGAVLVLWSVFLYVDRHARWPAAVAPIAGCVACAAGLLWPGVLCEVPALGVGLFCAAAAVEAMS